MYDPKIAEALQVEGSKQIRRITDIVTAMLELSEIDFSLCQELDRDRIVPLETVFDNICSNRKSENAKMDIGGHLVKMTSQRFKVFDSSTACVTCGCTGTFFVKERHANIPTYHLNLYAIVDDKAVLMTKDHIIPRSKGGKDWLSNYQTMCSPCNSEKADNV